MWVIAFGDLRTGFRIYGNHKGEPFKEHEEAWKFAEEFFIANWVIVPLQISYKEK